MVVHHLILRLLLVDVMTEEGTVIEIFEVAIPGGNCRRALGKTNDLEDKKRFKTTMIDEIKFQFTLRYICRTL
jgi:hypothetical protein